MSDFIFHISDLKFHISYFETSSLESTGIDDAFMNIARFCVGVEDNNHSLLQPIYGIGYRIIVVIMLIFMLILKIIVMIIIMMIIITQY